MKDREFQAAILEQSRQPLIVDTVILPAELQAGQVLVKPVEGRDALGEG